MVTKYHTSNCHSVCFESNGDKLLFIHNRETNVFLNSILEIKTLGLVLEFEMWHFGMYAEVAGLISCSFEVTAQIWLDQLRGFSRSLNNFYQKRFFFKYLLFWPSEEDLWPLTASITTEVKNVRNFERNQWNKNFCRMHGLSLMHTISNSTTIKNNDKIIFTLTCKVGMKIRKDKNVCIMVKLTAFSARETLIHTFECC